MNHIHALENRRMFSASLLGMLHGRGHRTPPVASATEVFAASFPTTLSGGPTSAATVPGFDPTLGTLDKVEFVDSETFAQTYQFQGGAIINMTADSTALVTGPGVSDASESIVTATLVESAVLQTTTATQPHAATVTITDPAVLAQYENGTVTFTQAKTFSGSETIDPASTGSNFFLSGTAQTTGNITVTYTYSPTAPTVFNAISNGSDGKQK